MRNLSSKEVEYVSGGERLANDVAALGIVVGLALAPEVTLPMLVGAEFGLASLQLDNLGY